MAKKTISKLKKELDKWFSLYIRYREAINGVTRCFTCGKIDEVKRLQCGHFQSRRFLSTRFDEINCQVQCAGCNVFKYGEQFRFSVRLDEKYGSGTSLDLEKKSREIRKIARLEYEDLIKEYKERVEKLKGDCL